MSRYSKKVDLVLYSVALGMLIFDWLFLVVKGAIGQWIPVVECVIVYFIISVDVCVLLWAVGKAWRALE